MADSVAQWTVIHCFAQSLADDFRNRNTQGFCTASRRVPQLGVDPHSQQLRSHCHTVYDTCTTTPDRIPYGTLIEQTEVSL